MMVLKESLKLLEFLLELVNVCTKFLFKFDLKIVEGFHEKTKMWTSRCHLRKSKGLVIIGFHHLEIV